MERSRERVIRICRVMSSTRPCKKIKFAVIRTVNILVRPKGLVFTVLLQRLG